MTDAQKAALQQEVEKYKEMGGYPMQGGASEDPANSAMGEAKPESHDTGGDMFRDK